MYTILAILLALNFTKLVNFILKKVQKFIKNHNSELLNVLKLRLQIDLTLISRKISDRKIL